MNTFAKVALVVVGYVVIKAVATAVIQYNVTKDFIEQYEKNQ